MPSAPAELAARAPHTPILRMLCVPRQTVRPNWRGVAYPRAGRPRPAAGRHYAGAAYPSAGVPKQLPGVRSTARCAAILRWLGSLLYGIAALPLTGGAYAAAPPSPPQPAAVAPPSPCWEFKSQQERFERRTSRGNCTEAISEKISWLIYIVGSAPLHQFHWFE